MTDHLFPNRRRYDSRRQQSDPQQPASQPRLDTLIKDAHVILANCDIQMSPRKVHRLAQTFKSRVERNGWDFFDFLANAVQMDEQHRRAATANPEIVGILGHRDPTGDAAVARVMAESARRAARAS